MAKQHAILAVEQGRYDLSKVCPKCGSQFVKLASSGEQLEFKCGRCSHQWSSQGLDAYPVEKVGDLYLEFIDSLAEVLIENSNNTRDVIKSLNRLLVKDITGVDV